MPLCRFTRTDPCVMPVKRAISIPVASCENLMTARAYKPYFERHAMDVALVDVVWNGLLEARKIADMAEVYEMQVATHGHHSPLGSCISATFAAITPNYKRMEIDVDVVPWQDDFFSDKPRIEAGHYVLSSKPGWGTDLVESELAKRPWPRP